MTDKPKPIMELDPELVCQVRFPRSKRLRIRRKWRKDRARNWGPHPLPFATTFFMGAGAVLRCYEKNEGEKPAPLPPTVIMHPATWEKVCSVNPALRDKFDVRQTEVFRWPAR